MSVDYLLHELSVGYAIFEVVHQADTVGNRLKEVQATVQVRRVILNIVIDTNAHLGSRKIRKNG